MISVEYNCNLNVTRIKCWYFMFLQTTYMLVLFVLYTWPQQFYFTLSSGWADFPIRKWRGWLWWDTWARWARLCRRPLQPTNKPDILKETSGEFLALFLANKADIVRKTSGDFPAMFVVPKVDILNETSRVSRYVPKTRVNILNNISGRVSCHICGVFGD